MKFKELSPSTYAEEFIRSKILVEEDGTAIKSQRELSADLGVSRNAIKYALKRLQYDGDIRIKERQGIEINKKRDINLLSMEPMSKELKQAEMHIKHISSEIIKTPDSLVDFFGNATELAEIKRIRLDDKDVVSFEISYLDNRKFEDIASVNFNECSLYQILENRYGKLPIYGYENITCVLANESLATKLNVKINTPLYQVDSYNYSDDDKAVEHTAQFLPANKIKYHFKAKNIFDYQEDDDDDII
ncbi:MULTISPECIES: GntR family transcriptional regulator [Pediococcus]|jgi:DNA-binding GntR family transcriptional regulator|uniref:Transcriptional regulator, GntR family n=1 Tax=Pediococcus pentosaceus (strain ATCC 25745 / CCUG 21536 / LMG 10740 / 183-1w) TaxID=278197 RepID=Q03HP0_PEDPA|nr:MULTISPECIES: GntR family transcriptional regulator [Pediococcus]MCI1525254.1 GntR family transcriptional regulator [Lactobacillus crispatus]ABJ67282.1 transcriptional regulator, GntR family [Pediococcus pentosaceus ATCC 25745]KAF5438705.1 GntR family transcriptional regulator [Pediococcus sp. EKM202D]KAF5438830.1 GntR family transcriptional regulator [Pediococcus sp. EKM201D]MCI1593883.1 GntR family transcriptional regulator [Pediococcus pentosaceus]